MLTVFSDRHGAGLAEAALFALLIVSIAFSLDAENLLAPTTPYGGDHSFHVANFKAYLSGILAEGRLLGWIPNLFSGMAFPQFYPPFIFWLSALLGCFMPWQVAYKLMVLIGLFAFPTAVYGALRIFQTAWQTRCLVMTALFAFLHQQDNFAFGGNLSSVMAGEIAYLYGLTFFILFIATLYRGLSENRFIGASAVLMYLTCIAHPVLFAVGFFAPLFFIFDKNRLRQIIKIYASGGLLAASWIIGYLLKYDYSFIALDIALDDQRFPYGWPIHSLYVLFPKLLIPIVLIFLGILVYQMVRPKEPDCKFAYILFLLVIAELIIVFKLLKAVRFLPVSYLLIIIATALWLGARYRQAGILIGVALCFVLYIWQQGCIEERPDSGRIFNGYESSYEPGSPVLEVAGYLQRTVENERVLAQGYDPYPIRTFTQKDSLTERFFHTFSAPFIQQVQNRVQQGNSDSLETALLYRLYNVGWIVTRDRIKPPVHADEEYIEFREKIDKFLIYKNKLNTGQVVEALDHPVRFVPSLHDWQTAVAEWIYEYQTTTPFIALGDPVTLKPGDNCLIREVLKPHEISFTTRCTGTPHLIKVSYFPNWQVEGADKLYLVSPSFMLVFPDQEQITIRYENIWIDYLSFFAFCAGLTLLLLPMVLPSRVLSFPWPAPRNAQILTNTTLAAVCFSLTLAIASINLAPWNKLNLLAIPAETWHFVSGTLAYRQGDYGKALRHLSNIRKTEWLRLRAGYMQAQIYLQRKNTARALSQIKDYVAHKGPESRQLVRTLIQYLKANEPRLYLEMAETIGQAADSTPSKSMLK